MSAAKMQTVTVTADFTKKTGNKIKPMHGICSAPILGGESSVGPALFHYLEEASIPYSRFHDVAGYFGGGRFVDIPNIFRDFDADVNDPASYDFAHTDVLIAELRKYGVEPIYRLGITIENWANVKAYHVYPPKDFQKWAEICEHIIRHYNEGWADGYHYGIKHWTIWNEADVDFDPANIAQTWHGSREEFFKFYEISAKHIKKCFGDSIMLGGPGAMGFKEHEIWDPERKGVDPQYANKEHVWAYRIDFVHRFLQYVREHDCPLDFFCWHGYIALVENIVDRAKYCRALLKKYGFENVPDVLEEWNTCFRKVKLRSEAEYSARNLAVMLGMQKSETSILCYYTGDVGASVYKGLFNPATLEPYKTYYAFKSFGQAYKLGEETENFSDDKDVYTLAARNDKKGVILIANDKDEPLTLALNVTGADINSGEVIVTDDEYLYTAVGEVIKNGTYTVKAHSCVEIRVVF